MPISLQHLLVMSRNISLFLARRCRLAYILFIFQRIPKKWHFRATKLREEMVKMGSRSFEEIVKKDTFLKLVWNVICCIQARS